MITEYPHSKVWDADGMPAKPARVVQPHSSVWLTVKPDKGYSTTSDPAGYVAGYSARHAKRSRLARLWSAILRNARYLNYPNQ